MFKLLIVAVLALSVLGAQPFFDDYAKHECKRDCSLSYKPKRCYYELTIEWALSNQMDCLKCLNGTYEDCFADNCLPTDGHQRLVNVFNRILPGPVLEVCQGDEIIVDFTNNLMDTSSSIHWHGLHQRGTPYMDGVPFVTQCPVHPETSFRYQFIASEAGTHWYHSHSALQRANGAFGALIIHRANPVHGKLYDHDLSEHVITMNDWFKHYPLDDFIYFMRQYKVRPDFVSGIMVNGFVSSSNTTVPQMRFYVEQNSRYRFRLINTAAFICVVKMTIEDHSFQVISSDGYDIEPFTADSITITNGERYDIVIEANQSVKTYAIKFQGYLRCNLSSVANLVYKGSKPTHILYNKSISFKDTVKANEFRASSNAANVISFIKMKSLAPLDSNFKRKPDLQYYLVFDLITYTLPKYRSIGYETGMTANLNKIFFKPPPTPILVNPKPSNICNSENKTVCDASLDLCECLHMKEFPRNKLIELVMVAPGSRTDEPHPIHLHGYNFRVVAHDRIASNVSVEFVKELDRAGKIVRHLEAPPIKDTVPVYDGGYVVVRFFADNPGYWLLHCHMDFHQEEGMLMVFKTGDFNGRMPYDFPRCGNFRNVKRKSVFNICK